MASELVNKTVVFVKKMLINEATGNDWWHIKRVWEMSKKIQAVEGGNLELIELAALLHDLGDYKRFNFDESKSILVLRGIMAVLEISEDYKKKIVTIVEESTFVGDDTTPPSTLEGKIICDADRLDNFGAIGIARTFAMGGSISRVIYNPDRPVRRKLPRAVYIKNKKDSTSFNFFYEKILKLPDLMNTKIAKKLADERVKFTKIYLEKFLEEWEGEK